ncbi:unnamed protein product [Penicillium salamii]|uniref:Lysophospholipase n=1 Tax=Penicillium salamii TaxID=1612424 RepID=A0A9W4I2J9_9EURO|nr:unnamed protein product [Penicillium salamii]CAG8361336.1 unnamed protein product [Penicillium salamii]CAG8368833.1 unnamed protein product [Penicillium salamii]
MCSNYLSLTSEENHNLASTDVSKLTNRALPNAPNGYAPAKVDCPSPRPSVRSAANLSSSERDWLKLRHQETQHSMKDFFGHVKISDFDAVKYLDSHSDKPLSLPNVGIAVSGGGYRALMNGAGALKAFDSRTDNSTAAGQLGGLLRSATYLTGLSGRMTNTLGTPWQFSNSILKGPDDGSSLLESAMKYYGQLSDAVGEKGNAGFPITFTDIWGRMLSYQLIHAFEGGINYTWSSIAATDNFKRAEMPLPILVADGRNPGEHVVGGNATVYEFNPWEFGSFDPTIFGFAPLEYLGSKFEKGVVPSNAKCIRGYDSAGFVMGTSSSLFNQFLLNVNSTDLGDTAKNIIRDVLGAVDEEAFDIANYTNPFYHSSIGSPLTKSPYLAVVDGGEDLQNLPLHPLIQPERKVDVIFAVDSSADTNNWPDGTSLVATYERSLERRINNGTGFPSIPDRNTFVNLGLNNKPTFFGCDTSNLTGTQSNSPLVVYIPNSPYVTHSNLSTFTMSYNSTERDTMILNGHNVATMGNGSRDSECSTCVGCAVLSRSLERTNTSIPVSCNKCFERYCWNGTRDSRTPANYDPALVLAEVDVTSKASIVAVSMGWGCVALLFTILFV